MITKQDACFPTGILIKTACVATMTYCMLFVCDASLQVMANSIHTQCEYVIVKFFESR